MNRRSPPLSSFAPLALLAACTSGEPVPVGVGEPTDVTLAARYAVEIEVLAQGEGCVVGGLTAAGLEAEARVDQRGRAVTWVQQAPDAIGADWRLAGHICEQADASGSVLRLRGGRTAAVTAGDDYCLVDLSLPAQHSGRARAEDRCGDPDDAVVELRFDACGRLSATFPLGLRFIGDTCGSQPRCALDVRWTARPLGDVDAGAGCDDDAARDGGPRDGGVSDGGALDGALPDDDSTLVTDAAQGGAEAQASGASDAD